MLILNLACFYLSVTVFWNGSLHFYLLIAERISHPIIFVIKQSAFYQLGQSVPFSKWFFRLLFSIESGSKKKVIIFRQIAQKSTLKPQYSEQVSQTLFVHHIICNMLSNSSKWELGFVHYITKFTILRFVISRFEWISTGYFQK